MLKPFTLPSFSIAPIVSPKLAADLAALDRTMRRCDAIVGNALAPLGRLSRVKFPRLILPRMDHARLSPRAEAILGARS